MEFDVAPTAGAKLTPLRMIDYVEGTSAWRKITARKLREERDTLFFAAGPGEEEHGLYGRIDAVPAGTQGAPGQVQY
jgi:hypothetical protein